jgi:hypothetical protein
VVSPVLKVPVWYVYPRYHGLPFLEHGAEVALNGSWQALQLTEVYGLWPDGHAG